MKRLIPLVAAGALLAAAPAAHAAVDLSGGKTRLTLDKGTASALAGLGVKVAPTGPASAKGRHVTFPVTGGAIDPASAAGTIRHRGGLRLSAGGTRVTLKNYRVDVGRKITLSAKLGAGRVTILDLRGTPRVTRSGFGTNVAGLTAKLNRAAAKALNGAFGVKAFKKGLKLGKVRVQATPSTTELLAQGQTALALDPAVVQALASLGISPGVIAPATLDAGTLTASFPITGGSAALDLSAAQVTHSGGISLTKGATVVNLTDFDVRVAAAPQLFASLNGGTAKVAIIDLDLTGVTPAVSGRTVTLAGVGAKLTQGAADALNAAFGTTAFAGGLALGRATVTATGK
jgi:hypothetical protein